MSKTKKRPAAKQPKKSKTKQGTSSTVGRSNSPADVAALIEQFTDAVVSYLQWEKLRLPPHQLPIVGGILIGDGTSPEIYEPRRDRAAEWIIKNAPALAADLARLGADPATNLTVLRIGNYAEDPDNGPAAVRSLWQDGKPALEHAANQFRHAGASPAAKPSDAPSDKHQAAEPTMVLASEVWVGRFPSLSAFKAFLNRHPEIKKEHRGRRLLVDPVAALRTHAAENKAPDDPEPDDIQVAAEKIRQMKRKYGNSY